jgi:hypothetical protein
MTIKFLRDYPTKEDLAYDIDEVAGTTLVYEEGKPVLAKVAGYKPYKPKYKKGDVSRNFSESVATGLIRQKVAEFVAE